MFQNPNKSAFYFLMDSFPCLYYSSEKFSEIVYIRVHTVIEKNGLTLVVQQVQAFSRVIWKAMGLNLLSTV